MSRHIQSNGKISFWRQANFNLFSLSLCIFLSHWLFGLFIFQNTDDIVIQLFTFDWIVLKVQNEWNTVGVQLLQKHTKQINSIRDLNKFWFFCLLCSVVVRCSTLYVYRFVRQILFFLVNVSLVKPFYWN